MLNIVSSGARSGLGDEPGVVHQCALSSGQTRLVELAFQNRRYALVVGSLNPQEVSVAVESIRTAVQVGDIAGDHLLVAALQMSLGKMNSVGEVHHLAEKVGPRAEALDDAGNLRPSRARAPVIVGGKSVAGRFGIFDDANLGGRRRFTLDTGRNDRLVISGGLLFVAHVLFRALA